MYKKRILNIKSKAADNLVYSDIRNDYSTVTGHTVVNSEAVAARKIS